MVGRKPTNKFQWCTRKSQFLISYLASNRDVILIEFHNFKYIYQVLNDAWHREIIVYNKKYKSFDSKLL